MRLAPGRHVTGDQIRHRAFAGCGAFLQFQRLIAVVVERECVLVLGQRVQPSEVVYGVVDAHARTSLLLSLAMASQVDFAGFLDDVTLGRHLRFHRVDAALREAGGLQDREEDQGDGLSVAKRRTT